MNSLDEIIKEISKTKVITPSIIISLIREKGEEALKALELLESNRGYRIIVGEYEIDGFSGDSGDYIIFSKSNYCGCMSRHPINISRRRHCPHLISFKLLEALGKISVIEFEKEHFEWIIRYLKFNIEEVDIE